MPIPYKIHKISGSTSSNVALGLFIASLGVFSAFVAMAYFDKSKQYQPTPASSPSPLKTVVASDKTEDITSNIDNLINQLMTERQITDELNAQNNELHSKNEKLKQQLQKSTTYLSALEKLKTETTQSKLKPDTDYYNKVALNTPQKNLLQSQVNQFISTKKKDRTGYIKKLQKESKVRKNEVRSIALKKGETIWKLAKRAYGSGKKYPKILKANPQITEKNARYLKVGTLIRVPL